MNWLTEVYVEGRAITLEDFVKENYQSHTDQELARIISEITGAPITGDSVTQKRQSLGLSKTKAALFSRSTYKQYLDPPTLEADDVLVLPDVEAPFHDAEWCSNCVELALRLGIRQVILAGDFLHFDTLSSWTPRFTGDEARLDLSEEMEVAVEFSRVLIDSFEGITMILGNHERRLTARLGMSVRVKFLRRLLGDDSERFQVYPYYYAVVKASSGTWRVTHPKNSSVIPGRVAASLSSKHGCNVVSAHQHSWCETTSSSGHYVADCGCCVDPSRLSYAQLEDNTRPKMQQGAFLLHYGLPILLHPQYRPPQSL